MKTLFVTASGTDIGKTYVCCRLIEALSAEFKLRCIKPVVTGFDEETQDSSDTVRLLNAQNLRIDAGSIAATSPWRFRAAISADMASARESRTIPFDDLAAFSEPRAGFDLNLVEGIGGVMAPIDSQHTVLDWIAAIETEVLLVTGSYLGSLSHALSAIDVLTRRDRMPIAIVVSQSLVEPVPTAETARSLERHCGGIPLKILARDDAADAALLATLVQRLLKLR
jgi:dethiobiotin synthetase